MEKPITILIIDDNLNFLKAISEFISDHFKNQLVVLGTAQNAKDGIRLTGQLQPQVVLLDLIMPDIHGFLMIPLLRQVHPAVKIITTTLLSPETYDQNRDIYRQESLMAGADSFIPKYLLDKDLTAVVLKISGLTNEQKLMISTHFHN
jgi:DNA-binding NarL/FixJ family response regulator